jgi:lactoylglutathione lyase
MTSTTDGGVVINRPPRDGHMAVARSLFGVSIELLQKGDALPPKERWGIHGEHREDRSK